MKHRVRIAVTSALFLSVLCGGVATRIHAEGITITPIFQELMITSRTQTETSSFSITNQGETPQTYRLRAVNIEAADTSGGILFSGLSADFEAKHGLSQWLQFDQQTVTIGPKETKEIPFSIVNNTSLAPGGHYGALVAQSITNAESDSANKVALSPQAASLIFVKKIGGERYGLSFSSARFTSSVASVPKSSSVVMENIGDVHVVPRGTVVVQDVLGKEVARGAINTDSALILPGKKRELSVDLRSVSGGLRWPGKYTATITYRFDGKEQFETVKVTFWVVSLWVLLASILTIAVTVFLAYRYRSQLRRAIALLISYTHQVFVYFRKVMNRLLTKYTKK